MRRHGDLSTTAPLLAVLAAAVVGAWAQPAAADTLVLRDPDIRLEGKVVARTADTVHLALPLFRHVPRDPRASDRPQWRAEVLRVPLAAIAHVRVAEHDELLPQSRPAGDASPTERLDAASRVLAAGHAGDLDTARQLYRAVLDEVVRLPAADGGDGSRDNDDRDNEDADTGAESWHEMERQAAEGLLRFRLLDILDEWRRADEAVRERLVEEVQRYRAGVAVAVEYATVRILEVAWRLASGAHGRERVLENLRAALGAQRAALREFVAQQANMHARADGGWGEARLAEFRAAVQQRLAVVTALVQEPGAPEALGATRALREPIRQLQALQALADAALGTAAAERLRGHIARDTAVWRTRVSPAEVAHVIDGRRDDTGAMLREDNAILRELNAPLLARLEERVRDTVVAINDYRELLGLRRLEVSPLLVRAAQRSAERFQQRRQMGHGIGGSPLERARREGYGGQTIGENLYRASRQDAAAADTLRAWQFSPEHHSQLIRAEFRAVGLGAERYYWCLMLGDGR